MQGNGISSRRKIREWLLDILRSWWSSLGERHRQRSEVSGNKCKACGEDVNMRCNSGSCRRCCTIGGYRCCCYVDDCRCWSGNTRRFENDGDAGDRIALGSEPENGSDEDERMPYLERMEEILEESMAYPVCTFPQK